MDSTNRPISESYWVEPSRLLAGEYPGDYNEEQALTRIDLFIQAGFNTFIDLTQPNEMLPYINILNEQAQAYQLDLKHQRFPIGNFGLPTREQMRSILNTIDTECRLGEKYICIAGVALGARAQQ